METKRDMILRAYKWREDMKKKSDEELYAQTFLVFMYILIISHIGYMYNNFDKKMIIPNEIKNELLNIKST